MEPSPGLEEYRRAFSIGYAAVGGNLLLFETLDSTNRMARSMVSASLDRTGVVNPFVVAALEQTAGRGRQGRTWQSPRALGAYVSLVVTDCPREDLARLPLLGGVALCRGLTPLVPGACRLKWPNDVMLDGRKVGGLLIETVSRPELGPVAVVGFGVNHRHRRRDLPFDGATSVELAGGQRLPLGELAGRLVAALASELARRSDSEYAIAAYEDLSIHRQGDQLTCRTPEREVEGRFAGFERDGRLRLETGTETRLISSGEVWGLP